MKFKVWKHKKWIGLSAVLIFAAAVFLWAKAQYVVPIIMYHKIDGNSLSSKLSVSPKSFRVQMTFLKRYNYNVVKLEDVSEPVKKNRFKSKTIAITFDDGYEDNYFNAYPVLKELGLPATIFIITGMVGTTGYMT